ncbi:MAG: sulfite exporter TauE/SafE family protein [Actinomycetota bacterium]|nr:sulfite exporter TauE/SafE family protein [Actinomycetota bacterium]
MPLHLGSIDIAVLLGAVALGAAVQGSIGFGFALVAAPVLALVAPRALPATLLILALPMTLAMAVRERRSIDVRGFGWITAGRLVGTAGGVWLLRAVPATSLSALFGALVLAAAAASVLGPAFELGTGTRFGAGIASGVMGTAAAVGGPPLALAYRDRPGPELRATLAVSFVIGLLLSLGALSAAGYVRGWHLQFAAWLLPALALGLMASGLAARWLDERWLRPAVLAFAAVSGAAAVAKGIAG